LPPDPWKGVKNATEIPPNCHGFVKAADDGFNGLMTFVGSPTYNFSEDCLWFVGFCLLHVKRDDHQIIPLLFQDEHPHTGQPLNTSGMYA
jgi:hypothetical protein